MNTMNLILAAVQVGYVCMHDCTCSTIRPNLSVASFPNAVKLNPGREVVGSRPEFELSLGWEF